MVLRFGLIGCGRIAEKHAKIIHDLEETELIAVCDIKKDRVAKFSKEYKTKPYSNYKELLKEKEVDVVSICTPSGLHAQMTIDAANAGKYVVTEKPMALTLEGAKKMIEACKKNNVKLFVVKQNRYNPPVQELKRALDKGRFGKLILLNTTVRWNRPQEYYNQDKWRGTKRMDGGVLLNQASHHIDLIRWLGGEVESVFAYATTTHKIEVEDTAIVVLKFKNNAVGVIEATTCTYPKNLEGSVTILGEKGSVKIGGFAVNTTEVWEFKDYDNDDELFRSKSTTPSDVYGFGHVEVYKNIIGSIKNDKDAFIDGYEGFKTLELILAIQKSIETGSEVKLPLK